MVYGVGLNDINERVKVDGKLLKYYNVWKEMLNRCYSPKRKEKFPTYLGCSVVEEWKSLSNFKVWFDLNYKEGFALDKDILIKGNKVYGPQACVFVPPYLNNLLTDCGRARGKYPLGVCKFGNGYRAQCNNGYGKLIQKYFQNKEDAINWYSKTKKEVVRDQVRRALNEKSIPMKIAKALLRREF